MTPLALVRQVFCARVFQWWAVRGSLRACRRPNWPDFHPRICQPLSSWKTKRRSPKSQLGAAP